MVRAAMEEVENMQEQWVMQVERNARDQKHWNRNDVGFYGLISRLEAWGFINRTLQNQSKKERV
jgi:phage baseplate assembly protein gpV